MRQKGFAPIIIFLIAVIAGLAYFVGSKGFIKKLSTNILSTPTPSLAATPSPETYISNPHYIKKAVDQNTKTYTSEKLGISFNYLEKNNGLEPIILVKEIGNKVYLYPSNGSVDSGQYVEVFNKKLEDSLITAINNTILTGYSSTDCVATPLTENPISNSPALPSSYLLASIQLPKTDADSPEDLVPLYNKCPKTYTTFGGISYFLMDQNHPSKFVFFSIGQYAISGTSSNNTWQDTLIFTD